MYLISWGLFISSICYSYVRGCISDPALLTFFYRACLYSAFLSSISLGLAAVRASLINRLLGLRIVNINRNGVIMDMMC